MTTARTTAARPECLPTSALTANEAAMEAARLYATLPVLDRRAVRLWHDHRQALTIALAVGSGLARATESARYQMRNLLVAVRAAAE